MYAPPSLQHVVSVFQGALECSLVMAPREPGLTIQELLEIGRRCGFKDGEMNDVLGRATNYTVGSDRLLPEKGTLDLFLFREDPELRNYEALDFVLSELNEQTREVGGRAARLDRGVVVERAVGRGIPRSDAEAAVTVLVWAGQLVDADGILRSSHGLAFAMLPSAQRDQPGGFRQTYRREGRARAYSHVEEVIARRGAGRPLQIEPLNAFGDRLDRLGYSGFQLWWTQTVRELRQLQPETAPTATCVLAAALVEAGLTFVVRQARALPDAQVFRRAEFERDPRTWKIDDLVASAASGGEGAILNLQARARAEGLIRSRQRIHAGRLLSEHPSGPPELRPEEARDATATADLVVRAILDWLDRMQV